MSYTATVQILGGDGKAFPGDSLKEINSNNDVNEVLSVAYTLSKAADAAKANAVQEMKAMPVTIIKEMGVSSPRTLLAMRNNELLQKVVISFFRAPAASTGGGKAELYYTVTLKDALITKYSMYTGKPGEVGQVTAKPDGSYDTMECEELHIVYAEIAVHYEKGTHPGVGNQDADYKWKETHQGR